ncbi:hypothetical protein RM704_41010 [Streptomyces sp. DSM 3412]|uniref:Vegetative cell wall protein gp1 n=1 Tax=Streptomyces gottesmaniae TaxID=3075518 RepID=A0ABU2ZAY1_9ACTN|nr:hypothetical protein [Streptomyces sp. DSM 3412]MDT0573755.1 hypothetical protein [Streptomyces sp. DSM 3412]
MNGFLTELGKRLAERWLSLLVLPGALFLGVLAAGRFLGHARWYDVAALPDGLDAHTTQATGSAARAVLLLTAFLLAASACGLAAQALGSQVERVWLAADWPNWPKRTHPAVLRLIAHRQRRYDERREQVARSAAEDHVLGDSSGPAGMGLRTAVARHRLRRIADARPVRPTWPGDRLDAVDARLNEQLGVDVAAVWPLLWLHAPDTTRAEITAARDAMQRATTLAGWALLYLAVAGVWWPGALVSAAIMATAWHRFRVTTDAYATLVEAATRLHVGDLARHLGLESDGPLTRRRGTDLTAHLTEGRPSTRRDPRPPTT